MLLEVTRYISFMLNERQLIWMNLCVCVCVQVLVIKDYVVLGHMFVHVRREASSVSVC